MFSLLKNKKVASSAQKYINPQAVELTIIELEQTNQYSATAIRSWFNSCYLSSSYKSCCPIHKKIIDIYQKKLLQLKNPRP
jgi:hypothetical protein